MVKPFKLLSRSNYISYNKLIQYKTFFIEKENYLYPLSFTNKVLKKIFNTQDTIKIVLFSYKENEEIFNVEKIIADNKNIHIIETIRPRNDYPPIYGVSISYYEDEKLMLSKGVSLKNTNEAFLKAFGEYLERYNGYLSKENFFKLKDLPKIQPFNLKKTSFRINFLPKPRSVQKVWNYFPKSTEDLNGTDACFVFNTSNNKKELLPLSCIYYYPVNRNEFFLQPLTTNGGGGGVTLAKARLSSIYELIERDNFLLHWLTKISPQIISKETLPQITKEYFEKISNQYSIEIYILNTSYETDVFSCQVILLDRVMYKFSLGGCASCNVLFSIEKAFCEALTELHASEKASFSVNEFTDISSIFSNEKMTKRIRKNLYNSEEGIHFFSNLFLQGSKVDYLYLDKKYSKSFSSQENELEYIISLFKKLTSTFSNAYNLYFYEYSGDSLKKNNYIVSKAYVPCFMKLWLDEDLATPLSERVLQFAKIHEKNINHENDINIFPHPFS